MRGFDSDSSNKSVGGIWMVAVECLSDRHYSAGEQTFDCGRITRRGSVRGGRARAHFESVIMKLGDRCTTSEPRSSYVMQLSQSTFGVWKEQRTKHV
jgi:hypothetical protein